MLLLPVDKAETPDPVKRKVHADLSNIPCWMQCVVDEKTSHALAMITRRYSGRRILPWKMTMLKEEWQHPQLAILM